MKLGPCSACGAPHERCDSQIIRATQACCKTCTITETHSPVEEHGTVMAVQPLRGRDEILREAERIVMQDRNVDYDTPERNFERIAQMWAAYKGVEFAPHDVAVMQAMVKIARVSSSPGKADHWVDIAGYAACGGEVRPSDG